MICGFGGRQIPDDLAVLLQEIRVALGVAHDQVDGVGAERHTELGSRPGERLAGLAVESQPADMRKPKQPLGVGLGVARESGDLGQPGAHQGDRQAPLDGLVQRHDQRFQLRRSFKTIAFVPIEFEANR